MSSIAIPPSLSVPSASTTAPRPRDVWREGEPRLAEVMADPIVHLLMRRDGLSPREVWPQMLDAGHRLGRRVCPLTIKAA